MNKSIIFLSIFITASSLLFANNNPAETDTVPKPKYWDVKNTITFNSEQNMYENWEQGGVSSFAFSVFYRGAYNYQKNKVSWNNSAELGYGLLRQDISGKGIMHSSNVFNKSDDKIDLNSVFGYKAIKNWNYSGLLNLRSQFDDGFKDGKLVSSTLSPAILTSSIGFEYKPKPYFSTLFSFLTGKTTYVLKDTLAIPGNFGFKNVGQHWDFSLGSYIKIFYDRDIFKNVHMVSKLEFYYDYRKTTLLDTDINFETMITMKVNKYLSTFLHVQMVMNKDFSTALQIKERFGISIPITF